MNFANLYETILTLMWEPLTLWVLGVAIGLPLAIVVLGEWIERLELRKHPITPSIRYIRHMTLPILALLILFWQSSDILSISGNVIRVLETAFWFTVIYATLTLLGSFMRMAEAHPQSLLARIPLIFFTSIRAIALGLIGTYVVSTIWQIDISSVFTALGVGALAISFALQDTLSNLVSGLLLLADRPFHTGDWISYNGSFVCVEEISWRTTRLRSIDNSLIVVPNGNLSQDSIQNYGKRGTPYLMQMPIDYSDEHPPNYVQGVLMKMLLEMDGIKKSPAPEVVVNRFDDSVIVYDMKFWIDFADYLQVDHEVKSRLFYVAKRNHLPRPAPVRVFHLHHEPESTALPEGTVTAEMLHEIPLYHSIDITNLEEIASKSHICQFGKGESVVKRESIDENLYIIQEGHLSLSILDREGQEQPFLELFEGDILGAMALFHYGESPISAMALDDLTVIRIPHQVISRLLLISPKFAMTLQDYIEDRQRRIDTLLKAAEVAIDMSRPSLIQYPNGER